MRNELEKSGGGAQRGKGRRGLDREIFDPERFGEVWHDVLTMFNALCVTISSTRVTLFDCW